MSSRQEEKAKRKAEREAQEAAAAAKAARGQRVRMAGAGAVVVAVIVVAVALIASGGGNGDGPSSAADGPSVPIPATKITNLTAAEKAAGCVQLNPANEGRNHVTTPVTYKNSNPPASGPHNPVPADDGIYAPGNEPAKEHWVHTLEHGRIEVQYAPGAPLAERNQLTTLVNEKFDGTAGYHTLLFENNTNMPYKVAAVAWTHVLGCKTFNPRVFDAIRAFRKAYTDKGPELIP